ncbi:MAG TPA: L-threonylcarbamoyladenylate synthase [Azospirillaceae bacterium]|nr:L-threonylcarbamoyladenylate synthase [Azospirillaceae bacterium]
MIDSAPEILPATPEAIARAADALRQGRLVAFPTETVYGLGALANDGRAVAAVYAAKKRPNFNPLIVHIHDAGAAEAVARFDDRAEKLAEALWPGPLTLVLPRNPDSKVSLLATAGLDTVAVRVPAHPVARQLLQSLGEPVVAPSANRSGHVSPTTPIHVAEDLGGSLSMILAAGRSPIGVESTVLDLSGDRPVLLRPGAVTREQLEDLIGKVDLPAGESEARPKAPGRLARHYAPTCPLRLDALSAEPDEALLCFGPELGVRGGSVRLNLSPEGNLAEAAANLFAMLRTLDKPSYSAIAVMPIPSRGLGIAINDRLRRAAVPKDPGTE